jgi:predicted  nucleic acid-binding Zn-ribbon protein
MVSCGRLQSLQQETLTALERTRKASSIEDRVGREVEELNRNIAATVPPSEALMAEVKKLEKATETAQKALETGRSKLKETEAASAAFKLQYLK